MSSTPQPPSPAGLEARPLVRRLGCRSCGYDLRGLPLGGACPECGTAVWETVLDVVDPAAGQLPPIRRPIVVGNAIVGVVALLTLGLLVYAAPYLTLFLPGIDVNGEWLIRVGGAVVILAAIPAVFLRPPPEVAHEQRVRLTVIWLALALVILGLSFAATGVLEWAQPMIMYSPTAPPSGPRFEPSVGFVLMMAVIYGSLTTALFMLRRLVVTIGERSRQFRTARGGRQRIRDLAVATLANAAGFVLLVVDDGAGSFIGRAGVTIMIVTGLMLAIGLLYLVVNMVWIRTALRSPAPTLRDLMELPAGAELDHETLNPRQLDIDPAWSAQLQSLWDYDDPAATERAFLALETEAATAPVRQAEWLAHLARTSSLRRDIETAHARLDEAVALASPAMTMVTARIALERGRTHNSDQDRERARREFDDAWRVAREHGHDGLAVDAAHMLAIVSSGSEAQSWNQRALDLAESSDEPDARRWVGSLCNNLGWTHHDDLNDPTGALAYFERALAARQESGSEKDVRVARWCRARCLRSLGRLEEALAEQRDLASRGDSDGYVAEELGECLLALEQPDDARPHFARAAELLGAIGWLVEAEPERIKRLRALGSTGV